MTRQKSKKITEIPAIGGPGAGYEAPSSKIERIDLASMFKNISADEQQAIINFFNLHNAAIWIYNKLSTPAMEYVELSIKLSQEQIKQ